MKHLNLDLRVPVFLTLRIMSFMTVANLPSLLATRDVNCQIFCRFFTENFTIFMSMSISCLGITEAVLLWERRGIPLFWGVLNWPGGIETHAAGSSRPPIFGCSWHSIMRNGWDSCNKKGNLIGSTKHTKCTAEIFILIWTKVENNWTKGHNKIGYNVKCNEETKTLICVLLLAIESSLSLAFEPDCLFDRLIIMFYCLSFSFWILPVSWYSIKYKK